MTTKVLAGWAILFLFCCNPAWAQWPTQTYARQTYQWDVGARILDRPGTIQTLPLVINPVTLQTVFDTEQASDLDVSGGAEFRVQRVGNYDSTWEVRGFFDSWKTAHTFTGPLESFVFTPPGVPTGTELDQFDYDYKSSLFSVALNFKRACHPGCTLFMGPRYLNMDETVDVDAIFSVPGVPIPLTSDTRSHTTNNMIGINFGCQLQRPISRDLFIDAWLRAALMYNHSKTLVSNQTLFGGNPVSSLTLLDDNKGGAAGIGEVSIRLHYDVSPGHCSIYAGYEAMWLDGGALAPAQILEILGPPGPRRVETGNTIFAHGLVLGGMFRF